MTFISKYAIALQAFFKSLINEKIGEKFKIFIRAGFQLDAYLFVYDFEKLEDIEGLFDKFCAENTDFGVEPVNGNDKIRIFFNVLPISELEDSFYSSIVNNPNTIDYGPRYRFDSLLTQGKTEKATGFLGNRKKPKKPTRFLYRVVGGKMMIISR